MPKRFDISLNLRGSRGASINIVGVLLHREGQTLLWASVDNGMAGALTVLLILIPPLALATLILNMPLYLACLLFGVLGLWLVQWAMREQQRFTAQTLQLLSNDLGLDSFTPLLSSAQLEYLTHDWEDAIWRDQST